MLGETLPSAPSSFLDERRAHAMMRGTCAFSPLYARVKASDPSFDIPARTSGLDQREGRVHERISKGEGENGMGRNCWQITHMAFNGTKLVFLVVLVFL